MHRARYIEAVRAAMRDAHFKPDESTIGMDPGYDVDPRGGTDG